MTHPNATAMPAARPATTPPDVVIRDVGLRDGLQAIARTVPTDTKRQWLRLAVAAGLRELEVGSFVPARLLPQLADTAELVDDALRLAEQMPDLVPGLVISVLVPNLKGAERAMASGAHAMLLPLSASHAHSLANLRKTPDAVLDEIAAIHAARAAAGSPIRLEVGLSTAFGCTLQGRVDPDEVLRLVRSLVAIGVDSIGLADTVGYADPLAVQRLFTAARAVAGERVGCGHFHDTRGLGAANAYAAWQAGVRRFDGCVGGIGGCPHAPGASGNVATEDLAWLFAAMGQRTGLHFDRLLALRQQIGQWLAGEPLHGSIWRAGLPKTLAQPVATTAAA